MEVVGVDFLLNNFELDTIDSSGSICTEQKATGEWNISIKSVETWMWD